MKPGWKTSEFWFTLIGSLVPIFGGLPIPQAATVSTILAGLYGLGRAGVKVAEQVKIARQTGVPQAVNLNAGGRQ